MCFMMKPVLVRIAFELSSLLTARITEPDLMLQSNKGPARSRG